MRDIPVYTTEYGVASLALRDIPYLQSAYVVVRSASEPERFLEECVAFCKACGAERIYGSGHKCVETHPFYTAIWQMSRLSEGLEQPDAAVWPVQPASADEWQRLYNEKVKKLPAGTWMTKNDTAQMIRKGDGYFVHRDGKLLGIGRASGNQIDWLASLQPGAGRQVLLAMGSILTDDVITLQVASENRKAVKLYQDLGFRAIREKTRWYDLSGRKSG